MLPIRDVSLQIQARGQPVHAPSTATLPYGWDSAYPHQHGRMGIRFALPPVADDEPRALYFSSLGNQGEVRVGGHLLMRYGTLDDSRIDATRRPTMMVVPAHMLSPTAPTPVDITLSAQANRAGGLSVGYFGELQRVEPLYLRDYMMRNTAAAAMFCLLLLMSLMAGALWWKQGDPLYGLFAMAALFGALRLSDRLTIEPPLPWPAWGLLNASAMCAHLFFLGRFLLLFAHAPRPWLWPGAWWHLAITLVLTTLSFTLRQPILYTLALASVVPVALWGIGPVLRAAIRNPTREVLFMTVAAFVAVLVGLRDYILIRLSSGSISFAILPLAVFGLLMAMGWLIVERYSQQVSAHRELSATLADRVAQREAELEASHQLLRRQSEEQATLHERQRIMRDIHDGVGAHLVTLLSAAEKDTVPRDVLREQANAALDELRMAVDSLQPVGGDLVVVLATLRYRLQPRLEAAGLRVEWALPELPSLPGLAPSVVLDIQRILLEAFTNVLRHSGASTVRVSACESADGEELHLEVRDDGRGLPYSADGAQAIKGHGLTNMQARARRVGGRLEVLPASPRGTLVRLAMPMSVAATA